MSDDRNGKMIFVWGDPSFVVSNFDPTDEHTLYVAGSVAITMHYDGDFQNAGSLQHDRAFFVDDLQIPDLSAALQEMAKDST